MLAKERSFLECYLFLLKKFLSKCIGKPELILVDKGPLIHKYKNRNSALVGISPEEIESFLLALYPLSFLEHRETPVILFTQFLYISPFRISPEDNRQHTCFRELFRKVKCKTCIHRQYTRFFPLKNCRFRSLFPFRESIR